MRKLLITLSAMALVLLFTGTTSYAQTPNVTITEVIPPPALLHVGETATIEYSVVSDVPFTLAILLGDEYFPGRGIFYNGNDTAHHSTTATLQLNIEGKEPTADLEAPPEVGCPAGTAPAYAVVGVRFGPEVVSEVFPFCVEVVE